MTAWNGGLTRVVRVLLIVNAGVFMAQMLVERASPRLMESLFSLHSAGFARHFYWQFATYLFLHASIWHILLNMLTLFMIGPELERHMGARRFLMVYFVSGVLGGIGWLTLTYPHAAYCVGASGAVFGLLGAFAALFPRRPITLLVFFVLPVTLQAWVLVTILAFIQLYYLLSPGEGHVAYAAHLVGAVAGYIIATMAQRIDTRGFSVRRQVWDDRPNEGKVDQILDKIAGQGIHSLTQKERDILEKASRK